MFLFWSSFSGLLAVVVLALEGSDVLFDLSGCSLVMVISRLSGKDDMITKLAIACDGKSRGMSV